MASISDISSKDGNISVWERKEKDGNDQNPGLQFFKHEDLLVLVEFLAMSIGNPKGCHPHWAALSEQSVLDM